MTRLYSTLFDHNLHNRDDYQALISRLQRGNVQKRQGTAAATSPSDGDRIKRENPEQPASRNRKT